MKNIIKKIRRKILDNNLVFTRADKGKTVTALNKENNVIKTLEFLNTDKFNMIGFDPTAKFQITKKNLLMILTFSKK